MGKRTTWSPYAVEQQRADGTWRIVCYENSLRRARQAVRDLAQYYPGVPVRYVDNPNRKCITCPRCGMTSYNPNDIRERYCGACHMFHDEP